MAAEGAPLSVVTSPAGVSVWIDGRPRGRTPVTVPVAPVTHALVLRRDDRIDARYDVDVPPAGASVDVRLWRRRPIAQRVRPTFSGAAITAADCLRDGRVAPTVALPTDEEHQAWRLDTAAGGLEWRSALP